jgi:hypothetical protein
MGLEEIKKKEKISSGKLILISKNELFEKYVIKNEPITKIAEELRYSSITIFRYLKRYGIPIKDKKIIYKGQGNPMFGKRGPLSPLYGKKRPEFSGVNHPFFGKKKPEYSKRMSGPGNPMFGKHHTKETEQKIREKAQLRIGEKNSDWRGGASKCIDCNEQLLYRNGAIRCFPCNRKFLSGENSPWWTGGHTKFRKSLYSTLKYKQWRKAVFERDKYTCQICNQKSGNLEAHHIKRMILFVKEIIPDTKKLKGFQIRNILLEYKPLWNIDNGITLCKECHNLEKKKDRIMIEEHLEKKRCLLKK